MPRLEEVEPLKLSPEQLDEFCDAIVEAALAAALREIDDENHIQRKGE